MAWIPQSTFEEADNPEMERNVEAVEWLESVNRELKAKYAALDRNHPDYVSLHGYPIGFAIPEPTCAFRAQVVSASARLPDHLPGSGFGAVNSKIKDAIEAIEPGVHQFFPVEIVMPDGSLAEPYWFMNVVNRVNAIALAQCVEVYEFFYNKDEYPGWSVVRFNTQPDTIIAVRKNVIQGKALWYDYKFRGIFFSEALAKFIIENEIRGYRLSDLNYHRAIEV
jgi:hypothetical protein